MLRRIGQALVRGPARGIAGSVAIHLLIAVLAVYLAVPESRIHVKRGEPLFIELPDLPDAAPSGNPAAREPGPPSARPPASAASRASSGLPTVAARPSPRQTGPKVTVEPEPPTKTTPRPEAGRRLREAPPRAVTRPPEAPPRVARRAPEARPGTPQSEPQPQVARRPPEPPPPVAPQAPEPRPESSPAPESPKAPPSRPPEPQPPVASPEPATPSPELERARPAEPGSAPTAPVPDSSVARAPAAGTQVPAGPQIASLPPGRPSPPPVDIRSLGRGGGGGGLGQGRGGIEGEPIPLDSSDPNYSDWLERVRRQIKEKWGYPCVKNPVTSECEYKTAHLVVEFGVLRGGSLQFIEVREGSGYRIYDDYAANAIKLGSPFPPVPEALMTRMKRGSSGVAILASFNYLFSASLTNLLR